MIGPDCVREGPWGCLLGCGVISYDKVVGWFDGILYSVFAAQSMRVQKSADILVQLSEYHVVIW